MSGPFPIRRSIYKDLNDEVVECLLRRCSAVNIQMDAESLRSAAEDVIDDFIKKYTAYEYDDDEAAQEEEDEMETIGYLYENCQAEICSEAFKQIQSQD